MDKRGFFGPMKTLDSAKYRIERQSNGCLKASIDHAPMSGVTPEMVRWWFENIDMFTSYNGYNFDGPKVPAYRYWHPFDHISVRWTKKITGPDGHVLPGSVIAIEENIGGVHKVRDSARVVRFDDEQFNFVILAGGFLPVGLLEHIYKPVANGSSFYTAVTLGNDWPLVGPLVGKFAERIFSEQMLHDWILHNVEESGETEKFVPALYRRTQDSSAL